MHRELNELLENRFANWEHEAVKIDSGIGTSVDEYFAFDSYCNPQHERIAAGSHFTSRQPFAGICVFRPS